MRGKDEWWLVRKGSFGFMFIVLEHFLHAIHAADFVVIRAVLKLLLPADLPISDRVIPRQIPRGFDVMQTDQDAFQPVGDFNSHRVKGDATHLLEICELSDLLPVEPDLPAEPPGRDGGLFPIVFYKANI